MKRIKRKYETPTKMFDKERIEKEKQLVKIYGLTKAQELWRAEALLRKYRRLARELGARKNKEQEKIIIKKLTQLGILTRGISLDNILELTIENILDRRLQTIIFKKGLVNSIKQARQLITHGHVLVGNRKTTFPSHLISKNEEDKIQTNIPIQLKMKKNETETTT